MTKEKPQTEGSEIPLNKPLLDESSQLKEERRILKERLLSIENNRENVSQSVYKKVHSDYVARFQAVTDKLLEKKQDIDRELSTLYETRDKIQANLKSHKEVLEEIQFRQKLGEFSKEDYQTKCKEEEDKVARFEKVLSGVQANIKRYESIFEGEAELLGEEGAPLSENVDEWEKEANEAQNPLPDTEGGIAKEAPHPEASPEWMESTKPSLQIKPQMTIIAGSENVGKSYPVEGTLTLGRSHTNKIIIKDAKASRQHAEIKMRGNECILIDLNSSNGTLVNGQKIHEHILSPNDEIQVGDYTLQYQQ